MHSILFKAKLLQIEKNNTGYLPTNMLPVEYLKLLVPAAGIYFREDEECEIFSQHLQVHPFSLWLHDIIAKEDIILHPYTPYHILALHYLFEDSLQSDTLTLEERECNLFNILPGLQRISMHGGKKVLSVHINIRPEMLTSLVSKYPDLQSLAKSTLTTTCAINEQPYHINAVCDLIIKKILTCRYTGSLAQQFIHRCCVDLFLNFANQDAAVQQPFLFTTILHMETYQKIFNYLLEHPHKMHSLPELAYTFNLPEEQLAHGFKQHFSISVEAFMYMLKMMLTYQLLLKSFWSLQMITEAAGFQNIGEMTSQVEAYYDCTIKSLRRD
ncbi:AraC-type DNA-binding protein [Chitinophaga sp. CF118]|uniref:AraC family transcriptional regulator n=1 Tax=Chitinophaga sp. CF118 TaxID=1884367 RepID=UPI0008F06C8B|nr:AraC family transcriptional regulator [Chitinophaga sp. CF118]SFD20555.1 AraC-type DNA-binding protein [Chitinophaga sp. CF118]